jgi:putative nucleotidyltransferase with HDIG domain
VEVKSGDEFEELASSFNSMTLQLEGQFQALTTINDIDQAILQSLDREGIIEGVLNHLPFLLPASHFCIAVFDGSLAAAELTIAEKNAGQWRKTILTTTVSAADLQEFQQNHRFFSSDTSRRIPDFLGFCTPAFLVLPIFLENKLFAALICAHDGSVALSDDHLRHARQVADQLAVAFSNVQLIDSLEQFHWGTLTALARAIDAKSSWTGGHSERVTAMAIRIAQAMGLSMNDLKIMRRGGLLHDIGKIGTPAAVLDKPGKLEPDELKTMRDHVRIGLRILEPIPAFKEAIPIVAQHHEWFNGKGYPEGLIGEQIALHARIFAVADCYDALISDRPYRKGLPLERVAKMIQNGAGTQFDPTVIDAFLQICTQESDPTKEEMSSPMLTESVERVQ